MINARAVSCDSHVTKRAHRDRLQYHCHWNAVLKRLTIGGDSCNTCVLNGYRSTFVENWVNSA